MSELTYRQLKPRINTGTIGHIGDGKTTLTNALHKMLIKEFERKETEMKNQIKQTIISHANCTDGMMSAFLYYVYYLSINSIDSVEFIFQQYNKELPIIKSNNVIVTDFCFSKEQLENKVFDNKNVFILDHHETATTSYGGYGSHFGKCSNECNFNVLLEKDLSGAGLVLATIGYDIWKNLINIVKDTDKRDVIFDRIKYLAKRVQDRDLWKFEYADTKAVYELLNSIPSTFEAWKELIIDTDESAFQSKLQEMKIRVAMRTEIATEYANKAKIVKYGNKTFAVVNCPSNFASEVGDILGKNNSFAVMFTVSAKDNIAICSMRSNKDTGENVSIIAKNLGGGGHINAAGFSIDIAYLKDLFTGELFVKADLLNTKINWTYNSDFF